MLAKTVKVSPLNLFAQNEIPKKIIPWKITKA
jgi:hypothetical protein